MVHYTTFTNLRVTGDFDADNAFNASTLPVTSTGSTTARTLATRFADEVNVKDFGAVCNGVTDDTAAVQAAITAGTVIYIPPSCKYTRSSLTGYITKLIIDDSRGARVTSTDFWWQPTATPFELIAHRGFSYLGPENTLSAYSQAVRLGCTSLECDVQISSDGVPVVIHDDTVDRTTDGTGNVKDKTWAALAALDASDGFASLVPARVPSFAQFLAFARGRAKMIYPEIKGYRTQADIDLMMTAVSSAGMRAMTVWQSFVISDIQYVRARDKAVGVGFLGSDISELPALSRLGGPVFYLLNSATLLANPSWVNSCRSEGVDIGVWTVDSGNDFQLLIDIGITRIMSNRYFGTGA